MSRAEEAATKAYGGVPQLRRAFINGYEQAEKDMIELSSNWIYNNFWNYGNRNDLVEAFRKEMKEKL